MCILVQAVTHVLTCQRRPLLFQSKDAPSYLPGLRGVLGIFVALAACTVLQAVNLTWLNKLQKQKRVKNGKPGEIIDQSMQTHYHDFDEQQMSDIYETGIAEGRTAEQAPPRSKLGGQAFLDLTDRMNDEFVYVL